jgi:hypothetical protein
MILSMYDAADLAQDQMVRENICSGYGEQSLQCHQAEQSQLLGIQLYRSESAAFDFGLPLLILFFVFACFIRRRFAHSARAPREKCR